MPLFHFRLMKNDYHGAIAHFTEGLQHKPNDAKMLSDRADAHRYLHNWKKCIQVSIELCWNDESKTISAYV